jgi:hypothetical protein
MKRYLVLLFLPALLLGSGPDEGGYRWIDSDEPGGPQFEWIDISSSGTHLLLGDDDNQGPFALGFTVDFYGRPRDSIRVCSNGWLSFASQSHQFHHHPFPDSRDPNSLLAPLWADLDPAQGGSVRYLADTANGRFVVSWIDVPFHGTGDSGTFQAVLDTGGSIVFQYLRLPSSVRLGTDSCSVGIENDSGLTGLEYLRDGSPTENRLHDSLAVEFYRLRHDVCPWAVLRPVGPVLAGDSIAPLVMVWNPGLSLESLTVKLSIGGSYQEELTVTGLASVTRRQLEFPVWVPTADTHALELVTDLDGDECPANDTLRAEVAASDVGELSYDDGEQDTWFMKNGSSANDWAGAVRFSVPYSRFRLLGARVFVSETTPFSRVMVCPDSGGAPKYGSPYLLAESVAAGQPETWIEVVADTQLTTTDDLWLLAFWQQRATSPRIGEDRDVPIDGRTYFGSPTVRWFAYASGDLLARLRVDGHTGIRELGPLDLSRLAVSPNPFSRTTTLSFKDRAESRFRLRIRDAAGRRVRELRPSGAGTAVWDGRDQNGRLLSAGVYFVEARDGVALSDGDGRGRRRVVQVLLAR